MPSISSVASSVGGKIVQFAITNIKITIALTLICALLIAGLAAYWRYKRQPTVVVSKKNENGEKPTKTVQINPIPTIIEDTVPTTEEVPQIQQTENVITSNNRVCAQCGQGVVLASEDHYSWVCLVCKLAYVCPECPQADAEIPSEQQSDTPVIV